MTAKRHHYIPQTILKNFADRSDTIWFHRREFGSEVKLTHIKNIFVQSQLNTIYTGDGKDTRIEDEFGKLDSAAAEVFPQIIQNARDDRAFSLSDEAWQFCLDYLYYQIKRPPNAMLEAERTASLSEVLLEAIAEQDQLGAGPTEEERAHLLSTNGMAELRHNAMAFARIRPPEPFLAEFLDNCGLDILAVKVPNCSFIIGDPGLLSPTKAVPRFILPIAPDVAIAMSYNRRQLNVKRIRHRSEVRRINLELAGISEVIAGRDPLLLRFLATRRDGAGVGRPLD